MGRILCFDYGSKRVGVAMTDELKIIASPYETISPNEVIPFIKLFKEKNKVEKIVVGLPYDLKGNVTDATDLTLKFIKTLSSKFHDIPIDTYDERYTSKIAKDAILTMGKNKTYRQNKSNVDKISASLILQSYLERKRL